MFDRGFHFWQSLPERCALSESTGASPCKPFGCQGDGWRAVKGRILFVDLFSAFRTKQQNGDLSHKQQLHVCLTWECPVIFLEWAKFKRLKHCVFVDAILGLVDRANNQRDPDVKKLTASWFQHVCPNVPCNDFLEFLDCGFGPSQAKFVERFTPRRRFAYCRKDSCSSTPASEALGIYTKRYRYRYI